MYSVIVKKTVNVPVSELFSTWNDEYADIYKYNPNLSDSFLLDPDNSFGEGATRQCNMNDGKNWLQERVTSIDKNKQIILDIYDGTMPLKQAEATLDFKEISSNKCSVQMTMRFVPKMGLLGKMMVPMMKSKFAPMLQSLLDANAQYVEQGIQVNPTKQAA